MRRLSEIHHGQFDLTLTRKVSVLTETTLKRGQKGRQMNPITQSSVLVEPCSLAKGVSSPLRKIRSLHNQKKSGTGTGTRGMME
jgi:hypothetical protein